MKDYRKLFGKACSICGEIIDGKFVTIDEELIHSKCFICKGCGKSLIDGYLKSPDDAEDNIGYYCGDCYDNYFGEMCAICNKTLSGCEYTDYNGFLIHGDCINCCKCHNPFPDGKFLALAKPDDPMAVPDFYCEECYIKNDIKEE